MFTGLIEDVGSVEVLRRGTRQAVLTIATRLPLNDMVLGESIAVNGVCLTITDFGSGQFSADVSPETLDTSTLGRLERGARVNLERALRLSDRLGGHLVTGHIDGQGRLLQRYQEGNAWRLHYGIDRRLSAFMVAKGSVALDGISLTINQAGEDFFSVAVIPHTLCQTNLEEVRVGELVNIETDLIGKYVARLLGQEQGIGNAGVSMELLAKYGYL